MDDPEQCRSATITDLKELIKSLNDHQVDYLLIGGYSLFAHGYIRATTDIDIIVPLTFECGQKLKEALLFLPDKACQDIDPNWFIDVDSDDFGNIRVADAFVIDVMFNACGETYKSLKNYTQIIEIDGISIKTINLKGLLKTKQTTREKDISDRIIIERAIFEINKSKDKTLKSIKKASFDL